MLAQFNDLVNCKVRQTNLSQPFEELVGPYLPVLTQTVLLPFKGMIVYDGLMSSYRISFGPGIRRSLDEGFKEAKAGFPAPPSDPRRRRRANPDCAGRTRGYS